MSLNRLLDSDMIEDHYLKQIYPYLVFITDGKNYDLNKIKSALSLKYFGTSPKVQGLFFPIELFLVDKKINHSLKQVLVFLCLFQEYNEKIINENFLYQELDNLQHLSLDKTSLDNVSLYQYFEDNNLIKKYELSLNQKNINTLFEVWKKNHET